MSYVCKVCGNPKDDHPYRHPFISSGRAPASWDKRFLLLAAHVAGWSKDPSTQVGAVIIDDQRRVLATGYNGFPRGIADTPERLNDRPVKYALVVHAEMNAILQAGPLAKGATLYLYGMPGPPCANCTKHIIQSGITRIVTRSGEDPPRWAEEFARSREMLDESGVTLDTVE